MNIYRFKLFLFQSLLFLFNLLLCFASIICNTIVLYGAARRRALKSDATTILLLEALTVLDILITLANLVPVTVTSQAGRWVLGPALCVITSLVTRYLYFTELLVVSFISLHRLRVVLVRRAGRPSSLQRRRQILLTKTFLTVIFFLPFLPLCASLFGPSRAEFVMMYLSCVVPALSEVWEYVALSYLILPSVIVIISNLIITYNILTFNAKGRGGFFSSLQASLHPGAKIKSPMCRKKKLNHSTYLTILLICMVFMVTYSPVYVLMVTSNHENNHAPSEPWLGTLSVELLSLNVIANPIVYTFSNTRFRRYVINLIHCRSQDPGSKKFGDDETSSEGFISSFFSTARTSVATMRASVVSASRSSTVRLSKLSTASNKSSLKCKSVENFSSADQLKVGLNLSSDSIERMRPVSRGSRPAYRRVKSWNAVPAISENDQDSSHSSGRSQIAKPRSCSSIPGKGKNKGVLIAIKIQRGDKYLSTADTSSVSRCSGVTFSIGDSVLTSELPRQVSDPGTKSELPCKSILKTPEDEEEAMISSFFPPSDDEEEGGIECGRHRQRRGSERRVGVVCVEEVCVHNNVNRVNKPCGQL